jgi:D-alanyl-lipoteichoic acid acyltransferase DltB (MBOAT superfamily)
VLFPTATFGVFFCVVIAGAWALAAWPTLRKCWLIAASGYFYAEWNPRFVLLLAAAVAVNWGAARLTAVTNGRRRTSVVTAGIVLDLAGLAVFKYYDFFAGAAANGLARMGLHVQPTLLDIALPVGISFYCFAAVSYLVDVRRGRLVPGSLLDVATWLTFFPTLTSGPITRAAEFLPQLATPARTASIDTVRAFWLIGRGLTKKLVVASFLASALTDKAFADPSSYNAVVLLLAVYAYAAQIYVDFSGYTDMAIGISALLGFTIPDNFNRPYAATSVQDFWSRWHMTLSRWLRDYLFTPLTGRRADRPVRVYGGIVAVMLLAGLWHGAAWGFVVFGGVHGVAMALERWQRVRRRRLHRPPPARTVRRQALRRIATFHVVCLGWVFFATGSVGRAIDVLTGIATQWSQPVTSVTPLLLLAVAAVIAAQYLPVRVGDWARTQALRVPAIAQAAVVAVGLVPVLAMAPTTVPAFIYYRF